MHVANIPGKKYAFLKHCAVSVSAVVPLSFCMPTTVSMSVLSGFFANFN